HHLVERPFQVDRSRARLHQHLIGAIEIGFGAVVAHGKRHAISRGGANQRRAAHQHGANRFACGFRIRDFDDDEFMRQAALVDRAHRETVGLEPDAAEMFAVDLHALRPCVTQPPEDTLHDRSNLPATASSFFNSTGSRASGAVISALSSARSEPIGHGSCSLGKSPASRATRAFALSALELSTWMMSCTVTAS